MKWILVFFGSGIGGCLRLFVGELARRYFSVNYPLGTFLANVAACLLLGIFIGFADSKLLDDRTRLFLTVGLCGGFSTFSTFSYETVALFTENKIVEASTYVAASLITCVLAIIFGNLVARQL